MSTEDDKFLLEEFTEWLAVAANTPLDLSVDAFLTERRHRDNERRIAEVLNELGEHYPPAGYQDLDLPNDHMFALDTLYFVREALKGDYPYTTNTTITGATERIYT